MKLFLSILIFISLTACNERKLKITKVGDFMFRRSYAAIQFRDVSDNELDSIERSNPGPGLNTDNPKDSLLMLHLQKEGILDSAFHLVRSKFPEAVPHQFTLINKNGNQLQGRFVPRHTPEFTDLYTLTLANKKQEINYELEEHYGALNRDISYLLLDLIPGGFREIVILNEFYISNGDNSNIMIYTATY